MHPFLVESDPISISKFLNYLQNLLLCLRHRWHHQSHRLQHRLQHRLRHLQIEFLNWTIKQIEKFWFNSINQAFKLVLYSRDFITQTDVACKGARNN